MKRFAAMILALLIGGGVSVVVLEWASPRLHACEAARVKAEARVDIDCPPRIGDYPADGRDLSISELVEIRVRRLHACEEAACSIERRFELEGLRDFGALGAFVLLPIGVIAGLAMLVRGRWLRPLRSYDVTRWDRLARRQGRRR